MGTGVCGGSAEGLSPVSGQPLLVLRVESAAERVTDNLIGHHPPMPGRGEPEQAHHAARGFIHALHLSRMPGLGPSGVSAPPSSCRTCDAPCTVTSSIWSFRHCFRCMSGSQALRGRMLIGARTAVLAVLGVIMAGAAGAGPANASPAPSLSLSASATTPSPTPSATSTTTPNAGPSPAPSVTPTAISTPTATPSPTPSATPIATPSPTPSATRSVTPSPTPSATRSATPSPTKPTPSPTKPTRAPARGPSRHSPTAMPAPPWVPTVQSQIASPRAASVHAAASPRPAAVPSAVSPAASVSQLADPPPRNLASTVHAAADTGPSAATFAVVLAALAGLAGCSFALVIRRRAYPRRVPKHAHRTSRRSSSWPG